VHHVHDLENTGKQDENDDPKAVNPRAGTEAGSG
jgi:hypothetical protein